MNGWTIHKGKILSLIKKDIDTDQILPKQFMKKTDKIGFGKLLFFHWRYLDEEGNVPNPDFILNSPGTADVSILLTGENFGCGSSREHAPWALADFGFKVVIAESFADIFYSNAAKNGIALIQLPKQTIDSLAASLLKDTNKKMTVDLSKLKIYFDKEEYNFKLSKSNLDRIQFGLDDIGMTFKIFEKIKEYEKRIKV
ncbi:3-isopropylmalate dehydratase small subunit [Leptospira ognonensis]|uniref:3-isopropylmalate dehydratase small subunit n=1 Tax=Leptospira ognonensis TaxID=2484945 RepID=A0A4R9JVK0_9LEPT|nr:3-isopropylmalate dehydratase small subunit [Leptospira ognonensis]TGL56983.1 3-isopropylmalate dehydratase small subunit [Leptospira ognonensis]